MKKQFKKIALGVLACSLSMAFVAHTIALRESPQDKKMVTKAKASIGKTDAGSKKLNTLKSWDAVKYCAKISGVINQKESDILKAKNITKPAGLIVKDLKLVPKGYVLSFYNGTELVHMMISSGNGKAISVGSLYGIGLGKNKVWEEVDLNLLKIKEGNCKHFVSKKAMKVICKSSGSIMFRDKEYGMESKPTTNAKTGSTAKTPADNTKVVYGKMPIIYEKLPVDNATIIYGKLPADNLKSIYAKFPTLKGDKNTKTAAKLTIAKRKSSNPKKQLSATVSSAISILGQTKTTKGVDSIVGNAVTLWEVSAMFNNKFKPLKNEYFTSKDIPLKASDIKGFIDSKKAIVISGSIKNDGKDKIIFAVIYGYDYKTSAKKINFYSPSIGAVVASIDDLNALDIREMMVITK